MPVEPLERKLANKELQRTNARPRIASLATLVLTRSREQHGFVRVEKRYTFRSLARALRWPSSPRSWVVRTLLLPSLLLRGRCALRARSPASREEFLKINIRVRGDEGERENTEKGLGGEEKKKNIRYRSVRPGFSPLFFPRCDYQLFFCFFFLFFYFSSREANLAHSRRRAHRPLSLSSSFFLDVTRHRHEQTVDRAGGKGRGDTDRFQGRRLASEEVGGDRARRARRNRRGSAGEFIFSEARTVHLV